jgi:hypothetical protein
MRGVQASGSLQPGDPVDGGRIDALGGTRAGDTNATRVRLESCNVGSNCPRLRGTWPWRGVHV